MAFYWDDIPEVEPDEWDLELLEEIEFDKCVSHREMCERYGYTVEEIEELAEIVEIE
jgi:hypothetical protein